MFTPVIGLFLIMLVIKHQWVRMGTQTFLFIISIIAVILPWLLRNYGILKTVTLSTVSSYNLLFYNAASLEADLKDISQDAARRRLIEEVNQEIDARAGMTEAKKAALYRRRAKEIILQNPGRYLYLHLKNDLNSLLPNITEFSELLGLTSGKKGTLSVLNQEGLILAVSHYFSDRVWLLWLFVPFIGILVFTYICAISGIVLFFSTRDCAPIILLILPVIYFLIIPGAPSHPRFRVPVMPEIALLAGVGWVKIYRWILTFKEPL